MRTQKRKTCRRTWYVLEWCALDDRIELYKFKSRQGEAALVYEEVAEGLHNFSSVLVMDRRKLDTLIAAVDGLRNKMKGGTRRT